MPSKVAPYALFVVGLSCFAACAKSPTQFVVAVDSDLAVPADITRIVARVQWVGRGEPVEHVFPLRGDRLDAGGDRVSLPFSFGVGPRSSLEGTVAIELRAENARDELVVSRRALTRFVPEQSLRLPMFLARSCRSHDCTGALTCTEIGCAPEMIDPANLTPVEPGEELFGVRRDGGASDAGGLDLGRPDGSFPRDGGPFDADAAPDADVAPDAGPPPCAPPAQDGDSCGSGALRCCRGLCSDTRADESACGPTCLACPETESCIDGECRRCAGSGDCTPDTLFCTDGPTCDEGVCNEPLFVGLCLIAGECFQDGAPNPIDPCLRCDVSVRTDDWSVAPGNRCDDGLFCTANDVCDANGSCVGSGQPCPTTGPNCLTHICDEDGDTCKDEVVNGACYIDNQCWTPGQTQPGNSCRACRPADDPWRWMPNVGAACNDGLFCTAVDTCDPSGICWGTGSPCQTAPTCAMNICIESQSTCTTMVSPNFCLIDGGCVPAGNSPVNQACLVCAPGQNQFAFSPRPNNTVCGVNSLCCGGVCTGANDGACGFCGAVCPNMCFCGGQGDPFSCACQ